jgi:hypothetical protein
MDEHELRKEFDDHGVPEHLRDGLLRYVLNHVPTGGFLQAVISNDLHEALLRADEKSEAGLLGVVAWCHWNLPGGAYGSPERYKAWLRARGRLGPARMKDAQ